ncbi:ABC transporter permease [Leptolyngbya sp. CCNP1308]|uniref:ABC transporter permease n=1 Tax=Leptolyngbya sp. CCNP1308 TaxID=3110255 RepID=UPI002B21694A|nr:ABC transporter permease [Leptolyngbya sp. CCNP1308]MEA5448632.1 ABC transporter permease [Leptolyngbya sp. CCNP1308]
MPLSPLDLSLTTLRDLTGNWVRSGLTALGIFMGVAAVNATLNIDTIANRVLQEQLAARDNPNITPFVYGRGRPPVEFDEAAIAEIQQAVPGILSISRVTPLWGSEVQYQGTITDSLNAFSVSENYQRTTGRQVLDGRFFDPEDFDSFRPVAVIDTVLAQQLFQAAPPLGEGIFINGTRFTVVGLIENKDLYGSEEGEPTGTLWVPEPYGSLLQGRFRSGRQIQIALQSLNDFETTRDGVEAQLQQMFPDYEMFIGGNVEDLYEEEQRQRASIRVLKAVGLLALVIGGVGIANITIAAIMERTREIGLRRAIGATDLEIMAQFIAEAALLSLIGGTTAVATVHGLTKVATTTVFEAPYEFNWRDAALSMGAAFGVGVGASFLPALRVTQIDVVQALRGE